MKSIPTKICKCGKTFFRFSGIKGKSHHRKKYCSNECRYKDKRKGIDYFKKCGYCEKEIPIRKSLKQRSWAGVYPEKIKYCSKKCSLMYRNKSILYRQHMSEKLMGRSSPMKGKKRSPESIEKGRLASLGPKHWNWKGGISPKNNAERSCIELKEWRRSVFKRDNYTCQHCGYKGKGLEADHIKSWAKYPELRFVLSNGRTLCKGCHSKTPNYRGRSNRVLSTV